MTIDEFTFVFSMGAIFGAAILSLFWLWAANRMERKGYWSGYNKSQQFLGRWQEIGRAIKKDLGYRLCKRISFGKNNNLKRWSPLDGNF